MSFTGQKKKNKTNTCNWISDFDLNNSFIASLYQSERERVKKDVLFSFVQPLLPFVFDYCPGFSNWHFICLIFTHIDSLMNYHNQTNIKVNGKKWFVIKIN